MKKFAASLLSTIIVLTGCNQQPVSLPSSSVIIEFKKGVGSGTKISDTIVLTAAHVVKDNETVNIKSEDGKIAIGRVLFLDEAKDLAVVWTSANTGQAAVDCRTQTPGTEFTILGAPLGMEFTYSWGRIASKPHKFAQLESVYTVDATIIMGDSGAAAKDKFGKVIGVVSAIRLAPLEVKPGAYVPSVTGFGFVVDGPAICKFLDEHQIKYNQ